jgi:2-oxoglutarate dehydrogenase E1 component
VSSGISAEAALKQVAVLQLIGAYRFLGVRHAEIDPLKRQEKPYIQELDPSFYGLSDADMETEFNTGSLVGPQRATLRQILTHVRETYCGSIGFEYMYISDPAQKKWIQQRFESIHSRPSYDAAFKLNILERLTAAETLEKYLHTKYVGQTRFSLEGGETLIPMLDILLQRAGAQGVKESVIGMAHRGRLNVLVNTLGKMPKDLWPDAPGARVQSVAPRDRQSGGDRLGTRTPAPPGRQAGPRGDAGPDPRRCFVRGAGRGDGDAEPVADARFRHRRHDAPDHQQPDRLHDLRSA